MDNEAILDQIVKSLSFEVVAIPQNVIHVDSTSKSTPLNVKIRVRKKQGAELRHGVLSMPKVATKSRSELPDRVRLVSSDHTIMNFDVLMEADFDKNQQKQKIVMPVPDLQVNDGENLKLRQNADDFHDTPILPKTNKYIFGRCKPGGCLDPPFGEEKYSYQPTQETFLPSDKTNIDKHKSSSIFKNNIFKKRKKCCQAADEINSSVSGRNSNEKRSHETPSPYSNTIITYPHPSDSDKLSKQIEIKDSTIDNQSRRKMNLRDERSKSSSIDDGSYFMLPKRSKNVSNQSDLGKNPKTRDRSTESYLNKDKHSDKRNSENKNILRSSFVDSKNSDIKDTNESQLSSQKRIIIPIPVPVPLISTTQSRETDTLGIERDIETNDISLSKDERTSNCDETMAVTVDDTLQINHKTNLLEKESYDRLDVGQILKTEINGHANNTKIPELNEDKSYADVSTTTQEMLDKKRSKYDEFILNENNNTNDNVAIDINPKSHVLLPEAREKSVIDIPYDLTRNKMHLIQNQTDITPTLSDKHDPYNSELEQIWENATKAPKSTADVISTKSLLPKNKEELNGVLEHTSSKISSENSSGKEKFEKTEKSIDEIKRSDFEVNSGISINTRSSVNSAENIKETNNTNETILVDNANDINDDLKLFKTNHEHISFENDSKVYDNTSKTNLETIVKQQIDQYETISDVMLTENIELGKVKIKSEQSESNIDEQQNTNFSQTNDKQTNKSGEFTKVTKGSSEIFSEDDDVTVKGLLQHRGSQSVSDQSIMGSESSTLTQTDDIMENQYDNNIFIKNNNSQNVNENFINNETYNTKLENTIVGGEFDENDNTIILSKTSIVSQPISNSILRPNTAPWKVDIALQSYVDKNSERIIKTLDSKDVPEKHENETLLTAKCYLSEESNEIKIPIDQENELSIKILNIKTQHRPTVEFNDITYEKQPNIEFNNRYTTDKLSEHNVDKDVSNKFSKRSQVNKNSKSYEEIGKKKIRIDVPSKTFFDSDYEEFLKSEAINKSVMNRDLHTTLSAVYEKELVPLQDIIKGLREEIDTLVAHQMKLKYVQHKTPKRPKSVRIVYPYRKCYCSRKI